MSGDGVHAFTFTPDDGVPPAAAPFAPATAAGPTLYGTGQMPRLRYRSARVLVSEVIDLGGRVGRS
jgi:hypothetical protein